jgi:hypothetical protein
MNARFKIFDHGTVETMSMGWLKRNQWKASIVVAGILLLLVFMIWMPVSVYGAQQGASTIRGTVTVQTTPTEDATVTALNKDQLTQQISQQQHTWSNWLWSNAAAILSARYA